LKRHKVRIALLFGGRSAEHEVSLASASAIYRNLDTSKYTVTSIFIDKDGRWRIVPSPLVPAGRLRRGPSASFLPWDKLPSLPRQVRADIYFPVLHGPYGEDGTIQGLLEMADVPYVGAGVLASAAGMDKAVMKVLFADRKLPLVRHLVFGDIEWKTSRRTVLRLIRKEFGLPFFVKPANLGSSVGISRVNNRTATERALALAFRYDRKVIVEEGIKGREIECSVLGNDAPRASLPGEVIPYREFYDYRDKYVDGKTRFRIPADLAAPLVKEVQRLAVEAYLAVGCTGLPARLLPWRTAQADFTSTRSTPCPVSPRSACTPSSGARAEFFARALWRSSSAWAWKGIA
jgi:D-alanine-D-alanine ligase